MFNPRFPHTLTIKRVRKDDSGMPITDDNGDFIYDTLSLVCVKMSNHHPMFDADNNFLTYEQGSINFGYRSNQRNTQTSGDVVVSDFHIACPMFLTEILVDDILEIKDYERTYSGKVVKKITFNLGTDIWFNEIKN